MLVTERAHAKINLALHIIGRRLDGYHELDSIVVFADIADVLTIAPVAVVSLDTTGPFASDLPSGDKNIVVAAWYLLENFSKQRGISIAPVKFHLEKNLPVASGIGGGSADAAAALRGLIRLFDLTISPQELNVLALKLGADVPVCLAEKSCRMRGIGEIIENVDIKLPQAVLLVNPLVSSPTAKVFEALGLQPGQDFRGQLQDLTNLDNWRNDLTASAISLVPEIAPVFDLIKSQAGMTHVRMSGSGATCFGLAGTLKQAQAAAINIVAKHPNWWVVATSLG